MLAIIFLHLYTAHLIIAISPGNTEHREQLITLSENVKIDQDKCTPTSKKKNTLFSNSALPLFTKVPHLYLYLMKTEFDKWESKQTL